MPVRKGKNKRDVDVYGNFLAVFSSLLEIVGIFGDFTKRKLGAFQISKKKRCRKNCRKASVQPKDDPNPVLFRPELRKPSMGRQTPSLPQPPPVARASADQDPLPQVSAVCRASAVLGG